MKPADSNPTQSDFNRAPLSDVERRLIEATTMRIWDRELLDMLALACLSRGAHVSPYDSPADLARWLEQVAQP